MAVNISKRRFSLLYFLYLLYFLLRDNIISMTCIFLFVLQTMITSLSFTTFGVDVTLTQNRLQLSFIILLTGVTFKMVSNQSLPKIPYLTHLVCHFCDMVLGDTIKVQYCKRKFQVQKIFYIQNSDQYNIFT